MIAEISYHKMLIDVDGSLSYQLNPGYEDTKIAKSGTKKSKTALKLEVRIDRTMENKSC